MRLQVAYHIAYQVYTITVKAFTFRTISSTCYKYVFIIFIVRCKAVFIIVIVYLLYGCWSKSCICLAPDARASHSRSASRETRYSYLSLSPNLGRRIPNPKYKFYIAYVSSLMLTSLPKPKEFYIGLILP